MMTALLAAVVPPSPTDPAGLFSLRGSVTLLPFAAALAVRIVIDIRRLHDRGKSGHWLCLLLLPIAAWIWAATGITDGLGRLLFLVVYLVTAGWYVVELGFLPGEPTDNPYGPAPPDHSKERERYAFSGGSLQKYALNSALDRIVADKLARDQAAEEFSISARSTPSAHLSPSQRMRSTASGFGKRSGASR